MTHTNLSQPCASIKCSDKEIFKVEVFGKNSMILINASIRILSINAQNFTFRRDKFTSQMQWFDFQALRLK